METAQIERETGWHPVAPFEDGLSRTIQWHWENAAWVERVKSG